MCEQKCEGKNSRRQICGEQVDFGQAMPRDELIEQNMQLVYWVAGRFVSRGLEWDDLCQAGAIGLMKAVDNFCPEFNTRLSTYAVPMIMGEIRRAVRKNMQLHISRNFQEKQVEEAPSADCDEIWTDHIALLAAFEKLPARLSYILKARYIKEETQAAIAERLGISQVQVCRLEKQALGSLRQYL